MVTNSREPALRRALVAVLVLVLTLSGTGRGWAAAHEAPHAVLTLRGVAIPICHSGASDTSDPAGPAHHDCCDQCVLCAPMLPPVAQRVPAPAGAEHVADPARGVPWTPVVARTRTPRQSQGPPVA